jgi:hypothetical protein
MKMVQQVVADGSIPQEWFAKKIQPLQSCSAYKTVLLPEELFCKQSEEQIWDLDIINCIK